MKSIFLRSTGKAGRKKAWLIFRIPLFTIFVYTFKEMKRCLLFWVFFPFSCTFAADSLFLFSPDKQTRVAIRLNKSLSYSIQHRGAELLKPSVIDLVLNNGQSLSQDLRIAKIESTTVNDTITSPVPEKRRRITDHYNQLAIRFRKPFMVYFRVYNDGVAYRIAIRFRDSLFIRNELAEFNLPAEKTVLFSDVRRRNDADSFHTSFESLYQRKEIDSLEERLLVYSPVLTGRDDETKLVITESDLEEYPGMFLTAERGKGLRGKFAPYPLKENVMRNGEFYQSVVKARTAYIARIAGTRHLPWRALLIGNDQSLPANDLVYRLAAPNRVKELSWIRPGQCTDEWIIGINLFNLPFESGINTATYKYYIDFANQFGIERIMMDAGWSNYSDLFDIHPSINMDTLAAYAKSKGVGLSLWTQSLTLERQLDSALQQFKKWGVDFIMTDFMDRDDQKMVNFYHRIAKACADQQMMIMFHGAYPPKGLNRTWPNVLTTEGVLGSEYNIWSRDPDPEHDVTLPFTRMLAGPMDYEPGLLDNATKEQFRPIERKVMSQGTRCHQLAMYVVYDSPLQVFSGNPSQAMQEPEFMQLLGSIPTTWDETQVLQAKVSDYIITARQKGEDWFIGGMTDWTGRHFELSFDFLDAGTYEVVYCRDGVNAAKYPSDYVLEKRTLKKGDILPVYMAPGGGFVLRLVKRK